MKRIRPCLPLVIASLAGGCATVPAPPAPGPVFVVSPGAGRDQGVFQQDNEACQQPATAQTGYGASTRSPPPSGPAAPAAAGIAPAPATASTAPAPAAAWIASQDSGFLQCMAARGNVVAAAPADYAAAYPGFAYGYAYPFGYFDPSPVYLGGIAGGFAYGGWRYRGWGAGGWNHGGWNRGGWARGGWGHGGWGHGGWGHGGWGHGGWGHGGMASGGHGGHH